MISALEELLDHRPFFFFEAFGKSFGRLLLKGGFIDGQTDPLGVSGQLNWENGLSFFAPEEGAPAAARSPAAPDSGWHAPA